MYRRADISILFFLVIAVGFLCCYNGKVRVVTAKLEKLEKTRVLEVTDGDTVKVEYHGEVVKVRLLKIDCFENKNNPRARWQAEVYHKSPEEVLRLGEESAEILSSLIEKNKENIYVELNGKDFFRRRLGTLYIPIGDEVLNVNQYMLKFGKCVEYQPKPRGWKPKRQE